MTAVSHYMMSGLNDIMGSSGLPSDFAPETGTPANLVKLGGSLLAGGVLAVAEDNVYWRHQWTLPGGPTVSAIYLPHVVRSARQVLEKVDDGRMSEAISQHSHVSQALHTLTW